MASSSLAAQPGAREVKQMNETITEQRLTTLETLTTQNSQNISRIVDAIYGNGKPGILTNIELMKADLATQRSERRSSIEIGNG